MLVGLCGYARVGKSTVGNILVEHHGFVSMGFADALREVAAALNPIIDVDERNELLRYNDLIESIGYDEAKRLYPEFRGFLQRLGTETGRDLIGPMLLLGDRFWVEVAMNRRPVGDVVFTDVRFPNEAAAIWQRGGIIVRVHRDGYGPVNDHPSETALDHLRVDYGIDNYASLDVLVSQVDALIAWLTT